MQGPFGRRAAFRYRVAGFALLVAHLSFVYWLTLRPVNVPWVSAATLEPLATIRADLALSPWSATRSIGGGLLLLAPLGVLLPLAGGRVEAYPLASLVRTAFTGAMVAMGFALLRSEVTGQIMNVDAVLLNTLGVALAHVLVVPAVRAWLRRRADRRRAAPLPRNDGAQTPAPTIPRVGIAPWSDVSSGSRT
ncbi:VanZ family protein [Streptomyces rugosispiralis]|uniref:VanZ family protein n=1 Tax=Streptomyces rugosispiralis TaxID=2967341 RepID=A0ABT1UYA1_9ACTN|nr:VanZ family protein [Streptomyces rugosispiralis]MCQ8189316.1 VanZ family protein [Streptomyces rugosispiralis]